MIKRFLFVFGIAFTGSAFAQDASPACADPATGGFAALGAVFGYFLTYSIRHGSKTQDVFKSFLGAAGAGGGAATTLVVAEACRVPMLIAYGCGTIAGFAVFAAISIGLALLYSSSFTYVADKVPEGRALFAETVAKVLLGEDFRPAPPVKKP